MFGDNHDSQVEMISGEEKSSIEIKSSNLRRLLVLNDSCELQVWRPGKLSPDSQMLELDSVGTVAKVLLLVPGGLV